MFDHKSHSIIFQISNLKTCSLSFDLSNSKQKAFFKEIESAKLRLPDIKRIRIDKITDGDADLNSFLDNWTPDRLELFWMNHSFIGSAGNKVDFYIDAICKTFKSVTGEVFIQCLKLTASDLEQIVKASSNSERLVIRFSDVSCSAALDFATADKYNTKFLSFYNWGNSGGKSDFISAPASFENIVEAMAKSGLKDSLQTLDIKGCGLDKTAVQGLLSKHDMGAVSVVLTGAEPMK